MGLENAVFGRDEEAMMNSLKQPTTMLWAGNDSDKYTGDGANKAGIEKSGGKVHEFTDMLHGWVSRGDVADPASRPGWNPPWTSSRRPLPPCKRLEEQSKLKATKPCLSIHRRVHPQSCRRTLPVATGGKAR